MSDTNLFGVPTSMVSARQSLRGNSFPRLDVLASVNVDEPKTREPGQPQQVMSPSLSSGPESPLVDHSSPSVSPSPSTSTSSMRAARTHQYRLNAAQEQRTYHDSCQRLLTHITAAVGVCENLRQSLAARSIYYPALRQQAHLAQSSEAGGLTSSFETASQPDISSRSTVGDAVRRSSIHSAFTKTDFVRQEERRQMTTTAAKQLSILSLDVKVGHSTTDVATLEKQTVTKLFDDKLSQCQRHLDNIFNRVADTSSKVLITGDLNGGKSTLVNALLKRDLLPADQQPCTSMFCEVLDATINDGVEQVHAIPEVEKYNRLDPSTYHVVELRHLYLVMTDHVERYKMLKIYTRDARTSQESLLHNGVVDIALIDSPGLNTDSVKTTAVFARQEEIDVVVFVVSAENHFTLSGKEFLWNAANEKSHIFIVVNRFDSIRDKERCKRLILDQIRQLSPATYADADNLVHFVSAGNIDLEPGAHKLDAPDFARLEERLRAFVLGNRTKSKLLPAKNYLVNLLLDIGVISTSNKDKAIEEYADATEHLQADLPEYERLLRVRDRLIHQIEKVTEMGTSAIQNRTMNKLNVAVETIDSSIQGIEYPGIFLIWQYAQDIADSMTKQLAMDIRHMEQHARHSTVSVLDEIHAIGTEHLGNFPRAADVDKMFLKKRDRGIVINVESTDFFDFVLDDKLSGAALSFGAVAMVGSRIVGIKDAVSGIWSMSTLIGTQNMRRLVVPVVSIAGVGVIIYIISDMRYAVERKLVRKFKADVRDSRYLEAQARRIEREARKILRVQDRDVQHRLQKKIEAKETKRREMEQVAEHSKERIEYYEHLAQQVEHLLEQVHAVQIEHTKA